MTTLRFIIYPALFLRMSQSHWGDDILAEKVDISVMESISEMLLSWREEMLPTIYIILLRSSGGTMKLR